MKDGVTLRYQREETKVKVEDAGDGTLTVTYDGEASVTTPEFSNNYAAEGAVQSWSEEGG